MMFQRLIIVCALLALRAGAAELVLNFGSTSMDIEPPGFTNALAGGGRPGMWRAVKDDLSDATNQVVLAQLSADVKDERFPMLIYEKSKFDDFTLTSKFKIVDGVAEQMAGLVFRYQDEKNFYVVRVSALSGNIRFYSVVNGQRGKPIGPPTTVLKGVWHELKIECKGNKIRAWLNGNPVPWEGSAPEINNNDFKSGQIGFWTKSDSLSRFADTRIEYTPKESLIKAIIRNTTQEYARLIGLKIYVPDSAGVPRVVASKDDADLGAAGGTSEQGAIAKGQVFYGKEDGTVSVIQPLRDRNGEPIAAIRVVMKSFPGQTEQTILQRALPIVRHVQKQVTAIEDLQ